MLQLACRSDGTDNSIWDEAINPAHHSYIRQRWDDSLNGQWLSKDRIWPRGGFNTYQFVENNAVTWADPNGRVSVFTASAGLLDQRLSPQPPIKYQPP